MLVKIAKFIQMLTYWPIYGSLRFFTDFKIEGQENLKGMEDKGVIFASNHASYIDGPICAASMPRNFFYPHKFFPIRFTALKRFFSPWGPDHFVFPISILVMLYVRFNGSLPVERTGGDLPNALEAVIKGIKNNDKIWFYPEGGLTPDGNLRKGKRGITFLQQQTGAPIVPVGIIGNYKILSLNTLLRKNKVQVRIGKPIYDLKNTSLEEGTEIVMSKIAELTK